jgi:hypothetical protein
MAYGSLNVDTLTSSTGQVFSPSSSVMKNRIINGAMVISQRNGTSSVTPANGDYTLDRWQANNGGVTGKFSVQQNAGSVTPPVGFANYLGVTSLSAYSVGTSDGFNILQKIEGFNFYDLAWGTANAKTITISFQVYSSLTGTFGGSIANSALNRCYAFNYSIPVANTWTSISVTIAGDTTGTWTGATNGTALFVIFGLGAGSGDSIAAGSWGSTFGQQSTGSVSVVGTNGATWYVTGVQLEVGTVATQFEYRQYGTELALCQRYYWKNFPQVSGATLSTGGAFGDTSNMVGVFKFPVTMRAAPTCSQANTSVSNGSVGATTSSLGAAALGPDGGYQIFNGSTASFSAGNGAYVYASNSSGYVAFNVEL